MNRRRENNNHNITAWFMIPQGPFVLHIPSFSFHWRRACVRTVGVQPQLHQPMNNRSKRQRNVYKVPHGQQEDHPQVVPVSSNLRMLSSIHLSCNTLCIKHTTLIPKALRCNWITQKQRGTMASSHREQRCSRSRCCGAPRGGPNGK